jgi:sporulation-control protein spo0M
MIFHKKCPGKTGLGVAKIAAIVLEGYFPGKIFSTLHSRLRINYHSSPQFNCFPSMIFHKNSPGKTGLGVAKIAAIVLEGYFPGKIFSTLRPRLRINSHSSPHLMLSVNDFS